MSSNSTFDVDVVIVGAGLSGLTAAHTLSKQGATKFVVLEAKSRVGGRNFASELASASGLTVFDLGGQWLGPTQVHVLKLAEELGLKTYEQYDEGINVLRLSDGRRRTFRGTIPSLNVFALLELHFLMMKLNRWAQSVPVENPAQCPRKFHYAMSSQNSTHCAVFSSQHHSA
jgi:monoamine oxidase